MMKQLAKSIGLVALAASSMNCTDDEERGPVNCKEAKTMYGAVADGPQTLFIGGDKSKPWSAYCADMASKEPKEFLDLVPFGYDGRLANYSEFAEAPEPEPQAESSESFRVRTHYQKVRIDPIALTIDITNNAFARVETTPQGNHASIALDQAVGYMPFGAAMECGDPAGPAASANIDLTGVPFELEYQHLCVSSGSRAIADAAARSKVVNFHAQGFHLSDGVPTCGRASVRCLPDPTINGLVGSETTIQLRYVPPTPGSGS